jgi:hypothetical protein
MELIINMLLETICSYNIVRKLLQWQNKYIIGRKTVIDTDNLEMFHWKFIYNIYLTFK